MVNPDDVMTRPDDMTYDEYKSMRTLDNKILKLYSKGRVIWDSSKKGTYVKSRDGKIGTETA